MLRRKILRRLKKLMRLLTAFLFALFVSTNVQSIAAQNAETRQPAALELGKVLEAQIDAGKKQNYRIELPANQFVVIAVQQRGIDVVVRAFNKTDDRPLAQKDLILTTEGREEISFLAAGADVYRLEIEGKPMSAPTGRYTIQVTEIRLPTEKETRLEEARKLHNDAILLSRKGKYNEAKILSEKSLAIREQESGADDLDVAASLANLALTILNLGEYEKAIVLQQRAVAIREKIYGADHADTARTLHNMAEAYFMLGNYDEAVRVYERTIKIREKVLGAESGELATTVGNLGELYRFTGDYAKAEPLMLRALEIKEKTLPPDSVQVAYGLSNVGGIYASKEDGDKALEYFQRALAIWEKTSGPDHPNTALGLSDVADIYRGKGDYQTAEKYLLRSLAILRKAFGEKHLRIANTLGNLAIVYNLAGDYRKAESYFRQTVEMFANTVGKEHRNYALALNFLAAFYTDRGDYAQAEFLHRQAIEIIEKIFGSQNPLLIDCLNGLARNYQAQGKPAPALEFWTRAHQLSEQKARLLLAASPERQKFSYLRGLSSETNKYVSAHLQFAPDNAAALELALTTIFERKGRVSDAVAADFAVLRNRFNSEDRILLDQLKNITARLAQRLLNNAPTTAAVEYQKEIKDLAEQKENLEEKISRRSAEFRSQNQPATIAAVRAALPENAALVEFSVYFPFDPKAIESESFGKPHYAAYVVRRSGEIRWKDLGETKLIDEIVESFRASLNDPKQSDIKIKARQADAQIMQPLRRLAGDATQLLISPDGELNLIPFEALVDEQNKYLVENYSFTYLSSGRDLLRMQIPRQSKNNSLIVANPLFGEPPAIEELTAAVKKTRKKRRQSVLPTRDLADAYFAPLGGTSQEANSIKTLFPDATFLTGARATETALKQTNAPRVLHIATHGFFLEDVENNSAENSQAAKTREANINPPLENPLLRSGLALAGANRRVEKGDDDGILTALEAANLNLWGTKLVVLSACDTGLGNVKNGEGVYGLRRSFVLAGTESLVMSLWSVSDYATRELMTEYYKNLKQGIGRRESLRQVQLAMLKRKNREHPFYWAAFIQSGEWANLDGKR